MIKNCMNDNWYYQSCGFRKIMILFPEEQKDYVTQELENVKADVMGTTTTSITEDQAKFLIKNQKIKELSDEDSHQLLIELSSKLKVYPIVIFFESIFQI